MKNESINICVVNSTYSLLIYFLKCGYDKNDFFIFSDGIPLEIRNNIPHYYFPMISIDFNLQNRKSNLLVEFFRRTFNLIKFIIEILKLRCTLLFKTRNKYVKAYGHAHLNFSFPLYESDENILIEDGVGNYIDLHEPHDFKSFKKIAHFMGFYIKYFKEGYGTHENIDKIYLTQEDVPEIIKNKVELIDMDQLWESKSKNQKKIILDIFNLNELNNVDDELIILLTQPFYESDLMSFDEEIRIYKEYIDKYPIIIKPHPREEKDYENIFPNTPIINSSFPVELLKYIGINIVKIITVCSTAALNFQNYCDVEIYDKRTSSDKVNEAIQMLKKEMGQ